MFQIVFFSDNGIERIVIGKSLKELLTKHQYGFGSNIRTEVANDKNVFSHCDKLKEIVVDNNNPYFISVDGVLFSKDGSVLYAFPAKKAVEKYSVPKTVSMIAEYAFYKSIIKELTIPDSVLTIGSSAFAFCKSLTTITMPKELSIIEDFTFDYCLAIKNISIPSTVREIRYSAFDNCESIESFYLPEGLEIIESSAFEACRAITSIFIPKSVTSFGKGVFSYCNNLKEVQIEASSIPLTWDTEWRSSIKNSFFNITCGAKR